MNSIRTRKARSVSFSVNNETLNKITDYCEERGCSRSWFISKALERYLNECLEDKADYEAAVAAWNEHIESGEKTYSLSEVRKEYGL